MKVGISNLAWEVVEDPQVAKLLQKYNVSAIDVVPTKYFPNLEKASTDDLKQVKKWWGDRGIEITGMQSLLYGTNNLNMFAAPDVQASMLKHLSSICRVGEGLGATRLVFGSPKCRDRKGLSDVETQERAIHFFSQLGKIADNHNVLICLEPNPTAYACNFMTDSIATANIVRQTALKSIRMQWDSGAIAMNAEDPFLSAGSFYSLIGHIHASEPHLVTLGEGGVQHDKMAQALQKFLPDHLVTIEMLAAKNEPHELAIEKALSIALRHYSNRH
jgi:sugar phosphate isomerase/epimerase